MTMQSTNKNNEEAYHYNMVPFSFKNSEIKIAFSITPLADGFTVSYDSAPKDLKTLLPARAPKMGRADDRLYLMFDPPTTFKGVVVLVDLMKQHSIARLYALHVMQKTFREQKLYMQRNFVHDLIVYLPQQKMEHYVSFSRMQLKIKFYAEDAWPALVISYTGDTSIMLHSLAWMDENRPDAAAELGKVIYDKQVYNGFDQLPDDAHDARDKVFPFLNKRLGRLLSIDVPLRRELKKHQMHWEKVDLFYQHHSDAIQKAGLQLSDQWMPACPAFQLEGSGTELLFGQGHAHTDIYTGLKTHGPYRALRIRQLVCFFIYTSGFEAARKRLQGALMGTSEKTGLSAFLKLSVHHDESMDIMLEPNENMAEQLRRKISQMQLDPGLAYLAVYISPFDKNNGQEQQRKVYHLIKEVLLQRNIASQTVVGSKVLDAATKLHFWLPNMAMAVIAKLGGIPWILDKIHLPSLVVGFGVYRSHSYDLKYEGSSFTFGDDGQFRGFEYYPAGSVDVLSARLEEALTQYIHRHGNPERLVVHYYKSLSKREFLPIQKMLCNFQPGLPVFVVKVNMKGTEDYFVKDCSNAFGLPQDGRVFRLSPNDYLLYVNRYTGEGQPKAQPMPVRCYLQSNKAEHLEDEATVQLLLQQVYDFSRLYWRSVVQPPMPVTVEYPRLLAMQAAGFDGNSLSGSLRDLPWFL